MYKCKNCGYVGKLDAYDELYDEDADDYFLSQQCPKCKYYEEHLDDDNFIDLDIKES